MSELPIPSEVVGQTPLWDMDWLYQQVHLLPVGLVIQLANGPLYGVNCTVCRLIGRTPGTNNPAGRLSDWHSELVDHPTCGRTQDPSRCGVIYGIAKGYCAATFPYDESAS